MIEKIQIDRNRGSRFEEILVDESVELFLRLNTKLFMIPICLIYIGRMPTIPEMKSTSQAQIHGGPLSVLGTGRKAPKWQVQVLHPSSTCFGNVYVECKTSDPIQRHDCQVSIIRSLFDLLCVQNPDVQELFNSISKSGSIAFENIRCLDFAEGAALFAVSPAAVIEVDKIFAQRMFDFYTHPSIR